MNRPKPLQPRTLAPTQMAFIGTVVLIVLPLICVLVFYDYVYFFYLQKWAAPELEEMLGFEGGYALVQGRDRKYESYALVQVDPDGPLGKAGVRPGDVPCQSAHGFEYTFLSRLYENRGRTVRIGFCTPPVWEVQMREFVVPGGP